MSRHLESALAALREASDVQLKKLYLKGKGKAEAPEDERKDEDELSEEDAELLKELMAD